MDRKTVRQQESQVINTNIELLYMEIIKNMSELITLEIPGTPGNPNSFFREFFKSFTTLVNLTRSDNNIKTKNAQGNNSVSVIDEIDKWLDSRPSRADYRKGIILARKYNDLLFDVGIISIK